MKYDETNHIFLIEPSINQKPGQYKITALLIDSFGAKRSYSFNIEVMNEETYAKFNPSTNNNKIARK